MANKKKSCRYCKEYVDVDSGIQVRAGFFCSDDHMIKFAIAKTEKQRKTEQNRVKFQRKRTFVDNDRSKQLAFAQKAFNEFIRLRDKDQPCISCGTKADVQYCAGHFRTRGGAPQLRFNQFNVHKQCNKHCNLELSGNIGEYRLNLIKKIGLEKVEWIEAQNKALNLSVQDIRAIKFYYRRLVRSLKNQRR